MATTRPRLRVLLLCDDNPSNANTMLDHIRSFQRYSRHRVNIFNPRAIQRPRTLSFSEFDVVVIHWSLSLIHDHYVDRSFRDKVAQFRGLKVQFVQDDYRWVDRMTAEQRRLGINVLFTLVSPEHFEKIWTARLPGVRLESTLAGYVPEELLERPVKAMSERSLDIVYRGREVPWWLGRLGQDKVLVGRGVKARAEEAGLNVDIAWTERDRIYGERWVAFLADSRATIGCEGGASITDFDGSIEESVRTYLTAHPGATFDDVHAAVLQPHDGNVPMNVMTPRLFEAAALRTALILFPGRYSDVLEPWRHYIPLEKDFSNFDQVARLIRDDKFLTELTQRTYREVAEEPAYSLRRMVIDFDRVLDDMASKRAILPAVGYQLAVAHQRMQTAVIRQRIAVLEAFTRAFLSGLGEPLSRARLVKYPGHYAQRSYAALKATARSRDRIALVARALLSRHNERPRVESLFEDMLKIELLCRGQRGLIGEQFRAWPHLLPDGVLELRSTRPGDADPDVSDTRDVVRALEHGEVTSVVWNHSNVAKTVSQPAWRKRTVTVFLGPDGHHEFAALRKLLVTNRAMAARVIRPALVPRLERPPRPRRDRKLRGFKLIPLGLDAQGRRMMRDPLGYLTRAYVMTSLIARRQGFRRLVRRYLADPRLRSSAGMESVLGDLLRLDALSDACERPNGFAVFLEHDVETGRMAYVSKRAAAGRIGEEPKPSIDSVTKFTWDHSAVGDGLQIKTVGAPIRVSMGSAGIYEFTSLALIARYEPGLIASILPDPTRGAAQYPM